MRTFDVAIVGAGSAGSAAARQLARRGHRVIVLDKRPIDQAGARWVNAVPDWMFARADVPAPDGAERRSHGERYVLVDASGKARVELPRCPTTFLDMRLLVARLQRDARDAGAAFDGDAAVEDVSALGRDRVLRVRGRAGAFDVRARLVVDAGGMPGAVRARVPALAKRCPPLVDGDVCLAAQDVRAIADEGGARAWLARHGLSSGQAIAFVGVAGGFSTRLVTVDLARGEVDLLAGALAGGPWPSGTRLLAELVEQEPWIGPRVFGGAGAIPLRRPYDILAVPGVALIGDAASMVFPAHGSGVGAGLVAARLLAEAIDAHQDPGSAAVAQAYATSFYRELGALFVAYDAFRRASARFDADTVAALLRAGFMNEHTASDGLAQVMPGFAPTRTLALTRAAARAPKLATTMVPTVGRMLLAYAVAKRFPAHPRLQPWVGRGLDYIVGATQGRADARA